MATNVIMPQGGQDLTEGRIVRWLKAEGEQVRKGEIICEVETEKAVFDVDAPESGVLLKIAAPEGDTVPILSVIGVVGQPGEQIPSGSPAAPAEADPTGGRDVAPVRHHPGKDPEGGEARVEGAKISGRARKLAEELGVAWESLQGTGPGGRIGEKDVRAEAERQRAAAAPPPRSAEGSPRGRTVPLTRLRSVVARRMQQSKQTVPHFYVTVSVDVTDAARLREELNLTAGPGDAKISFNDLIAKAVALALEEMPQVNCTLQGESIVYPQDINLGIAVGLDDGLVVPVLPQADRLTLREMAGRTRQLIAAAEAGKLPNLAAATFTISNLGMLGVDSFSAIINPPESAILAVGAIARRVVPGEDGATRIREAVKLTLSVDHRVLDGVVAARFLGAIRGHLENPRTLLPASS